MENHVETVSYFPIFVAIIVCFIVLLIGFYLGRRNVEIRNAQTPKVELPVQEKRKQESQKPRKRGSEYRWNNRGHQQQQHFVHPWHLTSFKGHNGQVLDINFSSNGKYLASCGDGTESGTSSGSTSSSEGNKENETTNVSKPKKGLSRRQKKNRRSVDSSPTNNKKKVETSTQKPTKSQRNKQNQRFSSSIHEEYIYSMLHQDILLPEQMFTLGYPELHNNKVRIMRQNFAPSVKYYNTSSDSDTSSEEDFRDAFERKCARCTKSFFATKDEYLTQECCQYHWGKVRYLPEDGAQPLYTCCKNPPGSHGCTFGRLHVWNGLDVGINDSLEGFVKTRPAYESRYGSYGIFALDCEMCYTVKGLELCKVTVVDIHGRAIYNEFVRPEGKVIDFNTRFSGVTEKDVDGKSVKNLKQVQRDLLKLINDRSILIGHALENDLRVLKILHTRIVDTSLIFPHSRGYPFRHSLKHLVSLYLCKEIQNEKVGHDSFEDASSCMELMLWKISTNFDP